MTASLSRVAIVGAGAMGCSIAALFARHGLDVTLIDPVAGALERARSTLAMRLSDLPDAARSEASARIALAAELQAAASAALVIEAVPENLALKQKIFADLDAVCDDATIFATNTSGLSITSIAQSTQRPDRFVGTHFFMPADVIPLVEVVRNAATSTGTVERVMTLLRQGGKRPVLVKQDIPGFIANRIQHALAREAMSLLEKGIASAEDIDEVVKWSLGIRLALSGPLEQRDLNGLDVHHAIASYLYADLDNRTTPSALLMQKVADGQLGAKTGEGFYRWSDADREALLRQKSDDLRALAAWLDSRAEGQPKPPSSASNAPAERDAQPAPPRTDGAGPLARQTGQPSPAAPPAAPASRTDS